MIVDKVERVNLYVVTFFCLSCNGRVQLGTPKTHAQQKFFSLEQFIQEIVANIGR